MTTVDEILASGRYTDRSGRMWEMCRVAECPNVGDWWGYSGPVVTRRHITHDQMRLLIERDQHRNECPGLTRCLLHPVPLVLVDRGYFDTPFGVYRGDNDEYPDVDCNTLPEAMDAARALAVRS